MIFFPPLVTRSFFYSHRGLFALILPYFAIILPFNFPFSHFLSLSYFFFPHSSFFFNIFPLFLFAFSYFFPQMILADIPPQGGIFQYITPGSRGILRTVPNEDSSTCVWSQFFFRSISQLVLLEGSLIIWLNCCHESANSRSTRKKQTALSDITITLMLKHAFRETTYSRSILQNFSNFWKIIIEGKTFDATVLLLSLEYLTSPNKASKLLGSLLTSVVHIRD